MAMTKEELLEMIDSTIYENENKAITGGALNAALTAIVEAMGTGSGGGGGNIYILPAGVLSATSEVLYTFTSDEVTSFKAAIEKLNETTLLMSESTPDGRFIKLNATSIYAESQGDGSTMWQLAAMYRLGSYGIIMSAFINVDATGTNITGYMEMGN